MFDYTIPGQLATKRLQFNQGVFWTRGGQNFSTPETLNLDAGYTYDAEGAMTGVTYPSTVFRSADQVPVRQEAAGPFYTYSLDTMHRAIGLADQNFTSVVSSVQYGPANELLSLNYFGVSESRSYNNMLQMTSLTANGPSGGVLNLQYRFSPNQNNGKITSQKDMLSGEEVQYSYDSLQRLISASTTAASDAVAPAWGETFGYDGFGNLNAKTPTKGSPPPPSLSVMVDTTNNQIVGQKYDANGNLLSLPSGGVGTYDVENHLACVACPPFGPPGTQYGYDATNKRIWRYTGDLDADGFGNATGIEIYLYGADGKQLGTYVTNVHMGNAATPLLTDTAGLNVYFRGKKVAIGPSGSLTAFVQDRLGSGVKTYPYGEEKTASGGDGWKFATYLRDGSTNLDYADQRYYTSSQGRFLTSDPYMAKASGASDPTSPQSWNRYAYVSGDPVNRYDPSGMFYGVIVCGGAGDLLELGISGFGGYGCGEGGGIPPFLGGVIFIIGGFPNIDDGGDGGGGGGKSKRRLRIPTRLVVEGNHDCYSSVFGSASVAERMIRYGLLDQDGKFINGATITEHLTGTNLPITGRSSSGVASGYYDDDLSVLLLSMLTRGAVLDLKQTFTVSVSGAYDIAAVHDLPVFVTRNEKDYGTLGVYINDYYVAINGDLGLNDNGTPRRCR